MKASHFLFLLFIIPVLSFSQSPGMQFFHTHDGLPSDEVYTSIFDNKGYLWFATSKGVCYFDGGEFVSFSVNDGLTENTILEVALDKKGRIWFAGLSGKLSYFEKGKIYPFSGNALIEKNKLNTEILAARSLEAIDTNEVMFNLQNGRRFHFKDSELTILDFFQGDSLYINKTTDRYQFYITSDSGLKQLILNAVFDSNTKVQYSVPFHLEREYWLGSANYVEYDDYIIYLIEKKAFIFYRNGKVVVQNHAFLPNELLKGAWGGHWIATKNKGLIFYDSLDFSKKPIVTLLNDEIITSISYDQNNRGWVTSLMSGVYHVQSLYVTNYIPWSSYSDSYITKIIDLGDNKFLGISKKNKFYLLDNWQAVREIEFESMYNDLAYNAKVYDNKLFICTYNHIYEVPLSDLKGKHANVKIHSYRNIKDFGFQNGILWIGSSTGLGFVKNFTQSKNLTDNRINLNTHSRVSRILPISNKENNPEFSYLLYHDMNQIWKLKYRISNPMDNEIIPYSTNKAVNSIASNDFILVNNETELIGGTQGKGLFWIKEDSVLFFTEKDGLLSNDIQVVKAESDSVLYLGTNKGINIVTFSREKYPRILSSKNITKNDGLRGSDIHDLIVRKDHVLAATDRGFSYVNLPVVLGMTDKFPIYITDFKVNGEMKSLESNEQIVLKPHENNLEIAYSAIDFHDKKNLTYYYRLTGSGNNEWVAVSKGNLLFPMLPAGQYSFQIKAQNSYGFWSENTATLNFTIKEVYYKLLWVRFLFSFAVLALFGFMFYLVFSRRNMRLQNEKVLADYYQQSLTRIMNPHFMFNALNTVNSFIVEHNSKEATYYVEQFALLIRQIFESAYQREITLEQEVALLSSYLKLEQRRSNNQFQYLIKVDPGLEKFKIPSILVQIFVENSVIHGFSDLKTVGALVAVQFIKINNNVFCIITDNGIGRAKAKEVLEGKLKDKKGNVLRSNKRSIHGIDITLERIRLLNTQSKGDDITLTIEDITDALTNKNKGTRVILKFPYKENLDLGQNKNEEKPAVIEKKRPHKKR